MFMSNFGGTARLLRCSPPVYGRFPTPTARFLGEIVRPDFFSSCRPMLLWQTHFFKMSKIGNIIISARNIFLPIFQEPLETYGCRIMRTLRLELLAEEISCFPPYPHPTVAPSPARLDLVLYLPICYPVRNACIRHWCDINATCEYNVMITFQAKIYNVTSGVVQTTGWIHKPVNWHKVTGERGGGTGAAFVSQCQYHESRSSTRGCFHLKRWFIRYIPRVKPPPPCLFFGFNSVNEISSPHKKKTSKSAWSLVWGRFRGIFFLWRRDFINRVEAEKQAGGGLSLNSRNVPDPPQSPATACRVRLRPSDQWISL